MYVVPAFYIANEEVLLYRDTTIGRMTICQMLIERLFSTRR